jgi:hypothetical protein
MREKLGKRKPNLGDVNVLAGELMNELEPWTELALVGRIYARYLDPSDLLVSEDPLLLRKHEFINLAPRSGKVDFFTPSNLIISSDDEGSYFVGGLAEFSLSAGHARAAGNHLGGPSSEAFAGALFGSVRGTDWRQLTAAGMQSYGATIRLAREWIVESAQSEPMHRELEQESRGILSLTRRKALLEAVDRHDWHAVWDSASVSDLHFLGDELIERAPADLWKPPVLATLKASAAHSVELDLLGQVAPDLSGCAKPRLRRYEPYEEYQRHLFPTLLAERVSEMKLYLAWLADDSAWPPASVSDLAATVADGIVSKVQMRDSWDWSAALEAYRNLKPELLEPLITQP